MPSAEHLLSLYPEGFYAHENKKKPRPLMQLIRRIFFSSTLVRHPYFKYNGRFLDYGCGSGWRLLDFAHKGWFVLGIEPAIAAGSVSPVNHNVIGGTIFDNPSIGYYDYILANHSLEHDPNAFQTIPLLIKALKAEGKLLIGVPNYNSLPARLFRKFWWYLGAPVHTYCLTLHDLERAVDTANARIVRTRYTGSYAGILGSLQIFVNRHSLELASTDGFLINNPFLMLLCQVFAEMLNLLKIGDAIEVTIAKR